MNTACTMTTAHCEHCGNDDGEDVLHRSYSGCCNELVVHGNCRGHHVQDAEFQRQLDDAVRKAGHASRGEMIDAVGHKAFERLADAIERKVYGD